MFSRLKRRILRREKDPEADQSIFLNGLPAPLLVFAPKLGRRNLLPKLIDREPYDIWVSEGRKSIAERAKEEVENLLQKNPPPLPDNETQKALKEIMLSDAQRNDMPSLPEIDIP